MKIGDNYTTKNGETGIISDIINLGFKVLVEVKADADCVSVAAASVLAKVSRDRMMRSLASDYPQWHFDTNKGYPCPKHRAALQGYGPSAIHRTSWAFMPNYVPWLKTN